MKEDTELMNENTKQNEKVLSLRCVQGLIGSKVLRFTVLRSRRQKYCMMYFPKAYRHPRTRLGDLNDLLRH